MSDLTPPGGAPTEVEGPLVSTGMGRGLHASAAVVLAVIGVLWGFITRTINEPTLLFLLLAGAIGLLGEVPRLIAIGEVRARSGDPAKSNRFLVIRRSDSPGRFYFYVATYLVLGVFSFLSACAILFLLVTQHAK